MREAARLAENYRLTRLSIMITRFFMDVSLDWATYERYPRLTHTYSSQLPPNG